jgi:thiosulfate/3-mercaptopyruvate sulfurtransferase
MKIKKSSIVGLIFMVSSLLIFTGIAWSVEFPGKIITAEWLKANIKKIPNLQIIDIRKAQEYAKGHIPGAVNLPYKKLRAKVMDVKSVRRPPEEWEKLMGQQLGIDENDAIVVYTGKKPREAGRFVWECDYYSHEKASMLNGGYNAWVKAGGKLSTAVPKVIPKFYVIHKVNADVLATNHFIMKHLKDPQYAVVDVRSFQQYSGAQAGKGIKRAGHVPGAINIPSGKVVKDGYILPPEKIVEILESKGVKKGQTIILTCRTGNRTCALYAPLAAMGYRVKMHDHSWTGWNELEYLPAEK